MYRRGRSQIRPGRSTRGSLRRPHGGKVPCQEDHEGRLLLAEDATRRSRFCEEVWQLPKVRKCSTSPRRKDDENLLALAIRTIRDGHHGSFTTEKKTNEVPTRRNWLLHKVDRIGSPCNNHRSKGTKFCMEKYYLQVRDTQNDHIK